jgi:hypothetical protein
MKTYTKKQIESKFNCILEKNRAFDSGTKFWTAFINNNGEIGDYLAEEYDLREMYVTLQILTTI